MSVFPTGAADRPQHPNVVDASAAQCLEIPVEPSSVELVGPGSPEHRAAEGIERTGRIGHRATVDTYLVLSRLAGQGLARRHAGGKTWVECQKTDN